ncbi:MAG: GRP family sugar transporter [Lactobacillus sp.]|nr:GRP family sugar transporter [Lactobacillus sp.]
MEIILLFLPVFGWGAMSIFATIVKEKTIFNQVVGTAVGILVTSAIIYACYRPEINPVIFGVSFLAGLCWVIGQVGQFFSFNEIGVSTTMPISTATQLIGVPICGVLLFGEWHSPMSKIMGAIGIIALIIGVLFTSKTEEGTPGASASKKVIPILILTQLGYVASSVIPKSIVASGIAILFGQAVGVFVGSIAYVIYKGQAKAMLQKASYKILPAGICWALGTLGYTLSMQHVGVNMAFVIAQLCVVVSTVSGIVILKETKTKQGLIYTFIGLALVIAGAVLTTLF